MFRVLRLPRHHRELVPLYVFFAVLLIVNLALDPQMFTFARISTLSVQFMPLILVAMAQTAVMLTGGIDLSVGAVLSLMVSISAVTMQDSPGGIALSIVATILCGAATGLFTGLGVTYGRLPAIIVTLATSYLWHGVALLVLPVPGGHVAPTFTGWVTSVAVVPAGVILVVIPLLFWKFFKNTRPGVSLYATGNNAHAAYVNGIRTNRARITAYVLAGVFTAVAGVGLSGQIGSGDPNIGSPYTLNSVAASILGGISFLGGQGQMKGTVIGAIIVGSLMNILFFAGISPFYQYVVQGLILVVAIGLKTIAQGRKGGQA
ncbi:ABC transporter permease [Cohnella caldifontis]|uniref:ABC transporter permease n=1 Tax=Cohnella caldifontis TaxID=3027471 RepID=UPI0023EC3995|nr:ABC transporter permease [Cohnella sp. YIM B05605]